MVSTTALFAMFVGGLLLAAAASMWWRQFGGGGPGQDVQATVTDATVVDAYAMNVDHALDLACEYRHDGQRYETRAVVHPPALGDDASAGVPAVPSEYRKGATVTVSVTPDRPGDASLPDPGVRATYRFAVPAIAATGVLAVAVGAWLAL